MNFYKEIAEAILTNYLSTYMDCRGVEITAKEFALETTERILREKLGPLVRAADDSINTLEEGCTHCSDKLRIALAGYVYRGMWSGNSHCKRKAVVNGYCKQHDPATKKQRFAEKERQWQAAREAAATERERQAAIPEKARALAQNIMDRETMDYQDLPVLQRMARELLALLGDKT